MTLRCPCGCVISGNGDGERSRNFRDHLIDDHGQEKESLRMLEVREELGEDITKGLLAMEMEMRAHLIPTVKSPEDILADSLKGCGGVCVTEFSMTKEQMEDYVNTITCPVCGRKVGGDDDGELCEALGEHCNGHEQLRSVLEIRITRR